MGGAGRQRTENGWEKADDGERRTENGRQMADVALSGWFAVMRIEAFVGFSLARFRVGLLFLRLL